MEMTLKLSFDFLISEHADLKLRIKKKTQN